MSNKTYKMHLYYLLVRRLTIAFGNEMVHHLAVRNLTTQGAVTEHTL